MSIRVGINGFGRIGRNFFRAAKQRGADIDFVAANDLGSKELMAHLLAYDTILGTWDAQVRVTDGGIEVDGDEIQILAERDPKALPVVRPRRRHGDRVHRHLLQQGAGVDAPRRRRPVRHRVGARRPAPTPPSWSASTTTPSTRPPTRSCRTPPAPPTASCPMVKVLDDAFGVENGLMTTVHAYTGTQSIVDGPSKDLREARAAAVNIIPSSTGAARATSLVLESMKGKLDGTSLRVPVPDGSITDFTGVLAREVTVDEVNAAFKAAAESGPLSKVLVYNEEPIVSSDIVGSPASCTFDAPITMANGNLVKVMGWYDNEWGYSNRLVDLIEITGRKLKG